jgi:hypothetical protein
MLDISALEGSMLGISALEGSMGDKSRKKKSRVTLNDVNYKKGRKRRPFQACEACGQGRSRTDNIQ